MNIENKKILNTLFETSCLKNANNEMIYDIISNTSCTYLEFYGKVNSLSKGLIKIGIKKNDYVGILANNSIHWLIVFFAICNIGGIAVLFNTNTKKDELIKSINYEQLKILFTTIDLYKEIDGKKNIPVLQTFFMHHMQTEQIDMDYLCNTGWTVSRERLRHMKKQVNDNDIATIQIISNTKGMPKIIHTSQKSIYENAYETSKDMHYTNKDIILLGFPLYHIWGYIATAITAFSAGSSICLMKKFRTLIALKLIENKKCTSFHGIPTMYEYLINRCSNYDLSSLKQGMVAGSYCSENIILNCFKKLELDHLVDFYGQTEGLSFGTIRYNKINYILQEGVFYDLE